MNNTHSSAAGFSMSLFALTLAAFCIGTSEFVIMGLLVDISNNLHISIESGGLLITAYAMGVVVGGPLIAVLTSRLPRKPTLIGLVTFFVLGNVLCALADNYHMLLLARIATAACHGTYFGVATVVAVQLVDKQHRAQAVAWVFLGTTLANMLGVPLGTAEGFHWGWRSTFWSISLLGIISILALIIWLPRTLTTDNSNPADEFRVLKKSIVQIPLALSALLNCALFIVYTYIAPLLQQVTHLSNHGITIVLLILGFGLPIGTLLGGKLGDRNLIKSLLVIFPVIMLTLIIMHFIIAYKIPGIITLFVWSTLTFTIAPMLQLMVVNNAAGAPNLASTFNQSAFNLGNAVGSSLGSILLVHQVNLNELPLYAAILLLAAWGLVFVYRKITFHSAIFHSHTKSSELL